MWNIWDLLSGPKPATAVQRPTNWLQRNFKRPKVSEMGSSEYHHFHLCCKPPKSYDFFLLSFFFSYMSRFGYFFFIIFIIVLIPQKDWFLSLFSDKSRFGYFFRVVPSDYFQAKVLPKKHWKCFGIELFCWLFNNKKEII